MANPHLPQEILLEIFSRLPTMSVGRCRTLSKSWKTHLSTPNFIKKHLFIRKQTIQQENLALVTKENVVRCPTKSDQLIDDESFFPDESYSVRGCCNGLILLNGSRCLIIMNPITLKKVTIPHLLTPVRKDWGYCNPVYGLGYDSCTDDYKIVQICGDGIIQTYVYVYSVKYGIWKTLDDGCYPYDGYVPKNYECEGGAFVNGGLHHLVCSVGGYRSCIAAFDLVTEVFSEIPLPREFVRQPRKCYIGNGVSVVGGCLSIVENVGNGMTEVWIMKEYGVEESWVKFLIDAEERDKHSITAMLCDLKRGTVRKVVLGEWGY